MPLDNVGIILDRTRHAANIGAVCRVMKNLGFHKLHLVTPTDYWHLMAIKMTKGAEDILESSGVHESIESAVSDYHVVCATSRKMKSDNALGIVEAAKKIAELAVENRVALLFGSEKYGLKRASVDRCDMVISLPVDPLFSSVNLAQAVTMLCLQVKLRISMLEGAGEGAVPERPKIELSIGERERLYSELCGLFSLIGFSTPSVQLRIKELFDRANVTESEKKLFLGLAKEIRRLLDK